MPGGGTLAFIWSNGSLNRTPAGEVGTGHEPVANVLTIFESLYASFFVSLLYLFLFRDARRVPLTMDDSQR